MRPGSPGIEHPLIVPMPRLWRPFGAALRRAVVGRLASLWRAEPAAPPIALQLPDGETLCLGRPDASRPALRAQVHDDRLFLRLLLRGEMGAGESYVAGEWSAEELAPVIGAFLRASGARGFESPLTYLAQLPSLLRHRRAANSVAGSERNIHAHYDLGNAFYGLFLDEATMAYSCALWPRDKDGVPQTGALDEADLAAAQLAKLERMCALVDLQPSDHLLEVGCGWGGLARHAAKTRGCRVTAITVSKEQHELAAARVAADGLTEKVQIQYRDYRDVRGAYDKILSIEMLEAVGFEYLPAYFATLGRALVPGGRLAVQSITMPDDRFEAYRQRVDWMQTYIFPGSLIPSLGAIRNALGGSGLALVSAEDIGPCYAPTLRAWARRFEAGLPAVRSLGFDEPFVRTWRLYLAFSEAAFAARTLGDHHLVFRKEGP